MGKEVNIRSTGSGTPHEQLVEFDGIWNREKSSLEKIYTGDQVDYIYKLGRIWTLGGFVLTDEQKESLLGDNFDLDAFYGSYKKVGIGEERRETVIRPLVKRLSNEAKGLRGA